MHAINLQYILFAQTVQGCTQGMHVFQVCMYMCCIHEHTFLQLLVVCVSTVSGTCWLLYFSSGASAVCD